MGGAAAAQLGKPNGTKVEVTTPISTELKNTHDRSYGVIRVPTGQYYVGTAKAKSNLPHKFVQMTQNGVVLKTFDQPTEVFSSPNGLYDLTYVETGGLIYGGTDYNISRKLFAFDVAQGRFDPSKSITIPAGVQGNAARALTFNGDGDNGKGSFWIADGASRISEISMDGRLLRSLPNVHPRTQAAAYNDEAEIVWWFGVEGSTKPNQGVVGYGMEAGSGKVTTLRVIGDNTIPGGNPAGGQVRGAQIWEAGTDHEDLWLLVLTDAAKDWFYEMHGAFVVEDGCAGKISFDGGAAWAGNLGWGVTLSDSKASTAALVLATAETLDGIPLLPPFKTGCRLYPRPDANFIVFPPVGVGGGKARQSVALPRIPALIGQSLFFQWFEIESTGNRNLGMSEEGEAYVHS